MYYSIRHITEFVYSATISESVMGVRMQPRTEATQRCLSFRLEVNPRARVMTYRDYLENHVHHFDIPQRHRQLILTAEALVEMKPHPTTPDALPPEAWAHIDQDVTKSDFWEALTSSHFARTSERLIDFSTRLGFAQRRDDPLSLLKEMNTAIYNAFEYVPQSTGVDSPIDHALSTLRGVCQDYSHVMITMARWLGIPCRYVSGYLFHREDTSDQSAEDATHAWVEAYLPGLEWVGFDPTNNMLTGERHIRVAIGRDYADVPPTRGVFKGVAQTQLQVGVKVYPEDKLPDDEELLTPTDWRTLEEDMKLQHQQQQQQQ